MGRKLLDIVLGTCLAFGMPLVEKPCALENMAYSQQTAAVGKSSPREEGFNGFQRALGKRYECLTDAEKKQLRQNFYDNKFVHQVDYKSLIPSLYGDSKSLELIDEDEKKSFNEFRIQNIPKERLKAYLNAFPWIKESEIHNIDRIPIGTPNPDKTLLWLEETVPHFGLNFNFDYLTPAIVASIIEKKQEHIMRASGYVSREYAKIFRQKK